MNESADRIVTLRSTGARLVSPSFALASCVRAYVGRSTVGMDLGPDQRLNPSRCRSVLTARR